MHRNDDNPKLSEIYKQSMKLTPPIYIHKPTMHKPGKMYRQKITITMKIILRKTQPLVSMHCDLYNQKLLLTLGNDDDNKLNVPSKDQSNNTSVGNYQKDKKKGTGVKRILSPKSAVITSETLKKRKTMQNNNSNHKKNDDKDDKQNEENIIKIMEQIPNKVSSYTSSTCW